MNRILVAGGTGYLGSAVVPLLIKKQHKVKVISRFPDKSKIKQLYKNKTNPKFVKGDIRTLDFSEISGVNIVVDLAAISGYKRCEENPKDALAINLHGKVNLAKMAKKAGVKRYVFVSSYAIYGQQKGIVDESTKPKPTKVYEKTLFEAEKAVLRLAEDSFCVTILRLGTMYGLSPTMRYDTVVHAMALSLYKKKVINVYDGNRYRLFVYVHDVALLISKIINAKKKFINKQIFNVGTNNQNIQINQLAQDILKSTYPEGKLVYEKNDIYNNISYKVSCDKIAKTFNFKSKVTPILGAVEVFKNLSQ